jgi:alpha-D-xyloside xylohydrolase
LFLLALKYSMLPKKKWDNLEIRVYEGANGSFTLYEDENDNYNYEKGAYSTIIFSWNNSKNELTISDRKGTFNGMLANRKFNIVRVAKNKGAGMDAVQQFDKEVSYSGTKVVVKL